MGDHRALVDYDRGEGIWGILEYIPNYARLPRVCEHVAGATRASYADLRAGLKAETPFVVIRHAPIGMVEYRANGSVLQPAACEADLVLGLLSPGAVVSVSETKVTALFWIRVVDVLLILLIAWRLLIPSPERLRPAT